MTAFDRLACPDAPDPPARARSHHNGVPACQKCGAELGFAASGGAIEWWRCIRCGQFYTARRGCPHHPASGMVCATCGRASIAFTVTIRNLGHDVSAHFCSKRCMTLGLEDPEARPHQ